MTRSPLEQASRLLATGFGTGFLRPASGTWGSLLGVVLFIPLLAPLDWTWQLAAGIGLTILATFAADTAAPGLGGEAPSAVGAEGGRARRRSQVWGAGGGEILAVVTSPALGGPSARASGRILNPCPAPLVANRHNLKYPPGNNSGARRQCPQTAAPKGWLGCR